MPRVIHFEKARQKIRDNKPHRYNAYSAFVDFVYQKKYKINSELSDLYVKDGSHIRLWHPSCVYITDQRQYTAVQKMRTPLK